MQLLFDDGSYSTECLVIPVGESNRSRQFDLKLLLETHTCSREVRRDAFSRSRIFVGQFRGINTTPSPNCISFRPCFPISTISTIVFPTLSPLLSSLSMMSGLLCFFSPVQDVLSSASPHQSRQGAFEDGIDFELGKGWNASRTFGIGG